MQNFQDTFETCKGPFISAFLILFHKISVLIECCILPTSQYKSRVQTPILLFQLLTPLQSGGKEQQRLISIIYNAKEPIKKMRWMALMAQKQSKELSNKILVQKGANLSRNKRQGNDVGHLLPNLVLQLGEERREIRNKVKRSEGEDLLIRLGLHSLLILRALRVRKNTQKPRGSMLYRIKINLNGISRLSLHLMQTQSSRNTSQRKAVIRIL